MLAIFDYDYIVYAAASAGEKRTILTTHIPTGEKREFATRTEFYGEWRKKDGGWLATYNQVLAENGHPPLVVEDFIIEDVQRAESVENIYHSTKMMIKGVLEKVGATSYRGYVGGKENILERLDRSFLQQYKGNRTDAISPIHKQDVIDYLVKHHAATLVEDSLEADDHVIIDYVESSKKQDCVVVAVDKDAKGFPIKLYNPNKPEMGILDCDCFGELSWEKGKATGYGRIWNYYQCLAGDPVDFYKPQALSEKKWGDKKAFDALKDCQNDRQAFAAMWKSFQYLYPEPVEATDWRGQPFTLSALHVMQEMFDMARMARWVGDRVMVEPILKKYSLLEGGNA